MSDTHNSKFLDDPDFQSLLVACLESLQRGETIDRDALAADFPRFASEVAQFLDDRQLLERVTSDFGDVEPSQVAIGVYEQTRGSNVEGDDFEAGDRIRYIGEYEILEEIARGGMGVVFKARQQNLKRMVALKMILAGRLADNADVERFQREAQAAGRLKHPNIVPVHEIGEHDGRHYFTMDLVEGQSLAEAIREETLAPRVAAKLVSAVAEAVHYAHEQRHDSPRSEARQHSVGFGESTSHYRFRPGETSGVYRRGVTGRTDHVRPDSGYAKLYVSRTGIRKTDQRRSRL